LLARPARPGEPEFERGNVGAGNEKSTENISAFFGWLPAKASLRIACVVIDRPRLPGGRVLLAA
jgi:hypothetical protein